ncbi:hypothetical protein HY490_01210 [Candidatus Woesearchaeota archaeon]|nr:hypothetical protein [Candidatus Woesearchaeota archaeon]
MRRIVIAIIFVLMIGLVSADLVKSGAKTAKKVAKTFESVKSVQQSTACAGEGFQSVGTSGCCEGLSPNIVGLCVRRCFASGEMPVGNRPCCEGLRAVGMPPICVSAEQGCRREGEPYSLFRVQCCEGLTFDESDLLCKPSRRTAKPAVERSTSVSKGCPADMARIEGKLDEILRLLRSK